MTYDPEFFANSSEGEIPSFGEGQYCSAFSGGALDDFMKQYPYHDAPAGYLWHR